MSYQKHTLAVLHRSFEPFASLRFPCRSNMWHVMHMATVIGKQESIKVGGHSKTMLTFCTAHTQQFLFPSQQRGHKAFRHIALVSPVQGGLVHRRRLWRSELFAF